MAKTYGLYIEDLKRCNQSLPAAHVFAGTRVVSGKGVVQKSHKSEMEKLAPICRVPTRKAMNSAKPRWKNTAYWKKPT
jgi:hypothetical protein